MLSFQVYFTSDESNNALMQLAKPAYFLIFYHEKATKIAAFFKLLGISSANQATAESITACPAT